MLSIDETRALSEVHLEFEPIIKPENPRLETTSKPDPKSVPYLTEEHKIPLRDGFEVDARMHKPRDVHLCALFTSLGGIAVNINYRHAPEHVFPQSIHDAFDATKWPSPPHTAKNAESLGIKAKERFLLGGESSGADIALAVAHLSRDEKMSPSLTGVFRSPLERGHFFSKEQNSNAPTLPVEALEFIYSKYQPDEKSPLAFPTSFRVCGLDPLRDCELVMEQVCWDDGVPTKLDVYPGLPHAFWVPFLDLEVSQKHTSDTTCGLTWPWAG
ncbi:Alpha/Beta hydrolase protein [Ilyonectria sp. MPI-CAGE-AT-0026]|nr:Alpha/Beta hydrolase protein [Ilyonectria sp. MPI-CAGE-AT-0026]